LKLLLKRLAACILGLADDPLPPGVKKLKNSNVVYRVRVNDSRIISRIEQGILTVMVVETGLRREVYRQFRNHLREQTFWGSSGGSVFYLSELNIGYKYYLALAGI
jgi:mRNA interferase RelE/StbE